MKLARMLMVLGVLLLAVGFISVPVVTQAEGGADVIKDEECTSCTNGLGICLYSTDSHQVMTPSGNVKLTCHFVIPEEYIPDEDIHNSGFLCGTDFGGTTDSFAISSVDGTVMLRCQIKPPKE